MTLTASDLLARLRALDVLLRTDDRFVYDVPLELGPKADALALAAVEQATRIGVPEPWRTFLVEHASSGAFCFHTAEEHHEALDVEWAGGDGGLELLDAAGMAEHRERILRYDPGARDLAFLPLAKDPSAATWICVVATPDGDDIALVSHDKPVAASERWPIDSFFEGWSRAGFPIDSRWEDQSEIVLGIFAEAMGLGAEVSDDED